MYLCSLKILIAKYTIFVLHKIEQSLPIEQFPVKQPFPKITIFFKSIKKDKRRRFSYMLHLCQYLLVYLICHCFNIPYFSTFIDNSWKNCKMQCVKKVVLLTSYLKLLNEYDCKKKIYISKKCFKDSLIL